MTVFYVVSDALCANYDTDLLEVTNIHTATERFERAHGSTWKFNILVGQRKYFSSHPPLRIQIHAGDLKEESSIHASDPKEKSIGEKFVSRNAM